MHRPPTAQVLSRALRVMLPKVTERLAFAVAGQLDAVPIWDAHEWRIARAVAVIHGISPLLAGRQKWQAPEGWQNFLQAQRSHTAARYARMAALLEDIDYRAVREGLAFLPLKGAALHRLELYSPGDRPMADIDLLVRPEQLGSMSRLLEELGYRSVAASSGGEVLVPRDQPPPRLSEHRDNGITIELHTTISHAMPMRLVDITATLWPKHPRLGRNHYGSLAALMGHLLMHAAVNMQVRTVRMIQLHDMALLAPQISVADWSSLLTPADGSAAPWWAMPPLQLLRRYYPDALPAATIDRVAAACPALLRAAARRQKLADVSVSNPRRALFPALLWAGSMPEACRFMSRRIRHGSRALRGRPGLPEASEIQPWIVRSHRRRALDVFLRRPRPETVMMLTAALASDPSFAADYEQPSVA